MICSGNWHEEIAYSSESCPLCAAMTSFECTVARLNTEADAYEKVIDELEKEAEHLRYQIVGLELDLRRCREGRLGRD